MTREDHRTIQQINRRRLHLCLLGSFVFDKANRTYVQYSTNLTSDSFCRERVPYGAQGEPATGPLVVPS